MDDILIPAPHARTQCYKRSKDPLGNMQTIRVYPESPGRLALQVRAFGRLGKSGSLSLDTIAHGTIGKEEAEQLRDALDRWLRENWPTR